MPEDGKKAVVGLGLAGIIGGIIYAVTRKKEPPVPPEEEVPPIPPGLPPAQFTVSFIEISPTEVEPGEVVTISALLTNVDNYTGSYTLIFRVNDIVESSKKVTLAGGAKQRVVFTTIKNIPGTYTVRIDSGVIGAFTVWSVLQPTDPSKFQVFDIVLPVQIAKYASFRAPVRLWLPEVPTIPPYYNRYMMLLTANKAGYPEWRDYGSQLVSIYPVPYYSGAETLWTGPGVYGINFTMVLDRYHAGIEAAAGVYEARLLVWTGWLRGEPPNYEFGGDQLIFGTWSDKYNTEIGEKVGEFTVL